MILYFLSTLFWGQVWAAALPQASLVITPSTGQISKEFTFDASDSLNTQGRKGGLEFRFQFANESSWTPWSNAAKKTYKPLDIGDFRARVQVRDTESSTMQTVFRNYRVVGDIYRRIRISAQPTKVKAGEPVYFELVLSLPGTEDPDQVTVRWDFDSDGQWDTNFSRQKIVTHVYSLTDVGQVSPTAEVLFPDKSRETVRGLETIPDQRYGSNQPVYQKEWDKIEITEAPIVPPIVNVSPGKVARNEDTIFTFDASQSLIPDHAWLEWNFYGEQFVKDKSKVSHKFTSPGTHDVRIRTCYDRAQPKCEETVLTVEIKTDPIDYRAEIRAQNLTRQTSFNAENTSQFFSVVSGDKLQFSASLKKRDSTSKNFTYRWDFQGDGIWDTTFSTASRAEYVFLQPGEYEPTIQVQNEDLVATVTSMRLKVVSSSAPRGSFTVDKETIYTGELVRFQPHVSDLQSPESKLELRFDADGDGNWDTAFHRSASHQWKYEEPGKYIAKMQIKDLSEKVTTVSRTVTVFAYEGPKAQVVISQRTGDTRTVFTFDASRSQGRNLKFFWDFDYQGRNDLISTGKKIASGPKKVTKIFKTPGEKVIGLRVVDGEGNEDLVHFSVWVEGYVLQPTPVNPEANPKTDNLYPGGGVPMDSQVPNKPLDSDTTSPNLKMGAPKEIGLRQIGINLPFGKKSSSTQKKTTSSTPQGTGWYWAKDEFKSSAPVFSSFFSDIGPIHPSIILRARQSFQNFTPKNLPLLQPERELVRADMFYWLYEPQLEMPKPRLEEDNQEGIRVAHLTMARNTLPLLTSNPFADVHDKQWFYLPALLSYRDRFSVKPFFYPARKITPSEAKRMIYIFTGQIANFGEQVTRGEFYEALWGNN
ncbi:PKD domain-containing protein [Candidatus Gracilibacteria bacterium]|nr:PKD domain-containing protein [Candidatus Gracilibacteria bacterium]